MRTRSRVSRLRRIIDVGLLAALIVVAGVLHRGRLPVERIDYQRRRLQAVGDFMERLVQAELQARAQALVDQDHDGTGEFLFLSELTGNRPCRGGTAASAVLEAAFGRGCGFATIADYHVTVYLPGEGAEGAVLDPELVALVQPYVPDPDAAERSFVAYAWPSHDAAVGARFLPAMAITEKGVLYWSLPIAKPYVGKRRPLPLAAFAPERTLGAEPGRLGQDGAAWISIEESRPWFDPNVLP